jgi:hypothetical protein
MTKDEGFALLADMRRKYLHARDAESGIREGDWHKGEPITAAILERWIPQVEALVNALPAEPSLAERETAIRQIPSARGDIAASGPRNGPAQHYHQNCATCTCRETV